MVLLYHRSLAGNAATIMEHVGALRDLSRFRVVAVNTELPFPPSLRAEHASVLVLHYSLFGMPHYLIGEPYLEYIAAQASSYKVAFFQDEHHNCRARFAFLNEHRIDHVYTLVDPAHWDATYRRYTRVPHLTHTLTGYVSDDLERAARRFAKRATRRTIDVAYRGRELARYMGRGAQEKTEIAWKFLQRAHGGPLRLDIATREDQRLYGDDWYRFLGNARAVLGVEAGVSIFDLDDEVYRAYQRFAGSDPAFREEDLERVLERYEGNIPYRTLSPRHFEAAAFRCLQILYEGSYSGVLVAGEHYVTLKKDFSNYDEVMRVLGDERARAAVVSRAHADLIGSERYTYRRFMADFDARLEEASARLAPADRVATLRVAREQWALHRAEVRARRHAQRRAELRQARENYRVKLVQAYIDVRSHWHFPGRAALKRLYRQVFPVRGAD